MLPNYFGPHIEYGSEEHQAVLKKVLRNIVGVKRISGWFKTVKFELSNFPLVFSKRALTILFYKPGRKTRKPISSNSLIIYGETIKILNSYHGRKSTIAM